MLFVLLFLIPFKVACSPQISTGLNGTNLSPWRIFLPGSSIQTFQARLSFFLTLISTLTSKPLLLFVLQPRRGVLEIVWMHSRWATVGRFDSRIRTIQRNLDRPSKTHSNHWCPSATGQSLFFHLSTFHVRTCFIWKSPHQQYMILSYLG